jgi:hypothetical protein
LLDFSRVVVYDGGTPISFVTMDIVKALRELYNEKKRLDSAIAVLEARVRAGHTGLGAKSIKGRRGRKSMSAAERLEVSKRMTLYWQARRAQSGSAPTLPPTSEDHKAGTASAS